MFGVVLVCWLLLGRRLVTLLDGVTLVQVERIGVERLMYDGSILDVGGRRLDMTGPAFEKLAQVSLNASSRVVLESLGRQFPLGPGQSTPYPNGTSALQFTKDPGDDVRLTMEQSRLAWPTPFEMNFMTGYSASRKRNVYFRLLWTKVSGAKLQMVWKTEQGYYSRDGWLPPRIESVMDGLIHVSIREANRVR